MSAAFHSLSLLLICCFSREDRNCSNRCSAPLSALNETTGRLLVLLLYLMVSSRVRFVEVNRRLSHYKEELFFFFLFLSELLGIIVVFHNHVKLKHSLF